MVGSLGNVYAQHGVVTEHESHHVYTPSGLRLAMVTELRESQWQASKQTKTLAAPWIILPYFIFVTEFHFNMYIYVWK